MMWSEVFRPLRVEQMVGNEGARLNVLKWLLGWVKGSKPLLLIGPPGVGKTSLVHALAHQFDYDLIEMNASDSRNRDEIDSRITPMMVNKSIFGKRMMLFLDEIDGISSREDTGGMESVIKMMRESTIPVIMAANSHDTKINQLAKVCKVIEFKPVPPRLLMLFLDHVLNKEKTEVGPGEKIAIINNSHGDIRSLLNIAQSKVHGYNVMREDLFEIDIANAINGFFSSDKKEDARSFLLNADSIYRDPRFGMSPEERRKDMLHALFSSVVSSRVDPTSLAAILDVLSKADIIVGRAGKNRQWSLLKYIDNIIAYNLFDKTRNKGIRYNQYSISWPLMGPIFARSRSIKNILSEMAQKAHTSVSIFGSIYFPYLIQILIDNKVDPKKFAQVLTFDEKTGEVIAKEMERMKKRKSYG